MKIIFLALALLIVVSPVVCFGQPRPQTAAVQTKWTRVETDDKELSAAFPPDFLVDAKTQVFDRRLRIVAFANGAVLELNTYKPENPKKRLDGFFSRSSEYGNVASLDFEGYAGRTLISTGKRYYHSVALASKENFYTLSVSAPSRNQPEVVRFLASITVKGKPLYIQKQPPPSPTADEEVVALSSLQTSRKILEALDRKSEDQKGKITYELNRVGGNDNTAGNIDEENDAPADAAKRPAIILVREHPRPSAVYKGTPQYGIFIIKLRAKLLANGQVGDIAVMSASDKFNYKTFIEAVKKTKFIPAEINGAPADSERLFQYEIETGGR